jgi:hypothetical protein
MITVTRTFGRLADIPLAGKALMHDVGLLARERVIRRTVGGTDAFGARFQAYAPDYEKRKREAVGGSGVDLQVSGAMLRAITIVEETDTKVVLGFKD